MARLGFGLAHFALFFVLAGVLAGVLALAGALLALLAAGFTSLFFAAGFFAVGFDAGFAATAFAATLAALFFAATVFLAGLAARTGAGSWGPAANPRSRRTVSIRARSLRVLRIFLSPSICPIDIWKRNRKICSLVSRTCFCN